MKARLLTILLTIAVSACAPSSVPDPAGHVPEPPRLALSPGAARPVAERTVAPAVWGGFDDSGPAGTAGLVAYTRGPLDVYDTPDAAEARATLDPTTILGTVTVLAVISDAVDGRVQVMLPTRPNGSTGWIEADQVSYYVANGEIVVDLGKRKLWYYVDGVEVLSTDVGIGSAYNDTPTGTFYVTDSVTLSDPDSAWGPHALGLSAHSDTITSFNGGDGIIGIHGTNNAASIGADISLGCVRLPNDMITLLWELAPIGTRVEIRA